MVNAFRAGTIVAVLAALVGWFMVLRRQSFAGHTLALVGFPGAAGAVLLGVSATYGLLRLRVAAALVHRAGARTSRARATARSRRSSAPCRRSRWRAGSCSSASTAASSTASTRCCSAASSASRRARCSCCWSSPSRALAVLAAIARPLLFASVDPDVAAARGVPARVLSVGFLVLLGVAAAEAARSPARCWCSRCSWCRRPPRRR